MTAVDLNSIFSDPSLAGPHRQMASTVSALADSAILQIATEVRAKLAAGESIINLTIGDFGPDFPIPEALAEGIHSAIRAGETNYPPATGVIACREAIQKLYAHRFGLHYPLSSVLVAGGARPIIAGTFLSLINPGDTVIYSLPSWNNSYYTAITGAKAARIATRAEDHFFYALSEVKPHLSEARLICLASPANPSGTLIDREALLALCEAILEENHRRKAEGRPALYLLYDMVYWMLSFPGATHLTPPELIPEMGAYTVLVDGVTKGLAGTGLRVGWGLGPVDLMQRMAVLLTHLGAWAPKAEQVATAKMLENTEALDAYLAGMRQKILDRLERIHAALMHLAQDGWAVEAIRPQGSVFMSLRFDLKGKVRPDGRTIETDEDTRSYLLSEAGVALVPFGCFDLQNESGWFRASAGAVSIAECEALEGRLRSALAKLR